MCIYARTYASFRQHADDEEHKEQDQKMRRQKNLVTLVTCFECFDARPWLYLNEFLSV